jgi:hypothetical protein
MGKQDEIIEFLEKCKLVEENIDAVFIKVWLPFSGHYSYGITVSTKATIEDMIANNFTKEDIKSFNENPDYYGNLILGKIKEEQKCVAVLK